MNSKIVAGALTTVVVANTAVLMHISSTNENSNREIRAEIKQLDENVKQLQEVVLYVSKGTVQLSAAEEECLTRNVFYEAGVEDYSGKIAVAQVTLNRLRAKRWGSDVCKVVYAPAQFSWTKDKKKRWSKPKGRLWTASEQAVRDFKRGVRVKNLEQSHFYHTDYIQRPNWADPHKQVHKIGQHIFYSEPRKT